MTKRRDYLQSGSIEFIRRQQRHRHNGFFGSVSMARAMMIAIHQAPTATPEAKALAVTIEELLDQLAIKLKIRLDHTKQPVPAPEPAPKPQSWPWNLSPEEKRKWE